MSSPSEFFSIIIAAVFVQNVVFVQLLVSRSFLNVLEKPASGMKLGALVTITMTVASALSWVIYRLLLLKFGLGFLSPLAYILVIVVLEVAAELLLRRFAPAFRSSLGRLLPASVFNCAVLGLIFFEVQLNTSGIVHTVFYGLFAGIGYQLAIFIMTNAMERVGYSAPPKAFKGLPIALVTACILSVAFMGFANINIPY